MAKTIVANDPFKAWVDAVRLIESEGHPDIDGFKNRKEINLLVITVLNPSEDNVNHMLSVIRSSEEWVYPSDDELRKIILDPRLVSREPTYGTRIRNFRSADHDQLEYVIDTLKNKPSTTKALITLWDPLIDGTVNFPDKVSLHSIFFHLNNSRELELTVIKRSDEILIGWPANFFQIRELQLEVSRRTGFKPGPITTISINAHIYPKQTAYFFENILKF